MNPVEIGIGLTVLILSLSIHEAAHAWTANRLGDPTARQLGRLTLNPLAHIDWVGTVLFPLIGMMSNGRIALIGWAKPVPVSFRHLRSPRRDFAIVALAGPVSNLLQAAVGAILFKLWMGAGADSGTIPSVFLFTYVTANVSLALFNLIPVPPLDGGNVLAGIAPESVAQLIDRVRPFGFFVLYGLMLTGLLWTLIGPMYFLISRWLLL